MLHRPLLLAALTLIWVLNALPARAAAQLDIKMVTWNVLGLDSNKVSTGPDKFLIGARVTNTGDMTATNLVSTFNWVAPNSTYINLGGSNTLTWPSLAAGDYIDFYYDVIVTRNTAAFFTARGFNITATADGLGVVQTPANRQLYVEKLVSQNRNNVLRALMGPSTVFVGGTYEYVLDASTATNGYEQIVAQVDFSNVVFQILDIYSTYTAPPNTVIDRFYADGCGWENNPLSVDYNSCVGPVLFPPSGDKVGGNLVTRITVKILGITGTGGVRINPMIYDYSGSSFHYNTDYNTDQEWITVYAYNPRAAGRVFRDYHRNLILEPSWGETGIAGVRVGLWTAGTDGIFGNANDVLVNTTTTDSSGAFKFDVLAAGTYQTRLTTADIPLGFSLVAGQSTYTFTLAPTGSITNLDAGYTNNPQLAVLRSFDAEQDPGTRQIRLNWETSAELGNAGFHVYREVIMANGTRITTRERVTSSIIPSVAEEGSGARYTLIDPLYIQSNELRRLYHLEDVSISGESAFHGPFAWPDEEEILRQGAAEVSDWTLY